MDIPVFMTERLLLRGAIAADFSVYERFYADGDASQMYGGPLSSRLAWKKLAADLGHWQLQGFGMWSVIDKHTHAMLGGCGLVWPEGWPRSELTWWVIPEARRKGIAFEASRAVIDFAYDVLKWEHVETHMNDDNIVARNLAIKLGGKTAERLIFPDGHERDIFVFARN